MWSACIQSKCVCQGIARLYSTQLAGPVCLAPSRRSVPCSYTVFGDPLVGVVKQCFCVSTGGDVTIYVGLGDGSLQALNTDGESGRTRTRAASTSADDIAPTYYVYY